MNFWVSVFFASASAYILTITYQLMAKMHRREIERRKDAHRKWLSSLP